MITVLASIKIQPGKTTEFLEIFKKNVPNVLAEKGCIEYFPAIDTPTDLSIQSVDSSLVTIVERWESVEALRAHLTAPHMQAYRLEVKDLVKDAEIKILQAA